MLVSSAELREVRAEQPLQRAGAPLTVCAGVRCIQGQRQLVCHMNKELTTIRPACCVTIRILPSIESMAGIFWGALIVSLIENGPLVMRIPYFWT